MVGLEPTALQFKANALPTAHLGHTRTLESRVLVLHPLKKIQALCSTDFVLCFRFVFNCQPRENRTKVELNVNLASVLKNLKRPQAAEN